MPRIRQLAALTGAAALALTAMGTPAHAATQIVGVDGTYGGDVRATLTSNLVISTTLLGTTTCTSSSITGTAPAGGSPLGVSGATFGGCSGTGNPTLTAVNTGTWGGGVTATAAGVGTLTISGFTVKANVTILGIPVTCTYSGTVTAAVSGSSVTGGEARAVLNASTINKSAGSFTCPGSANLVSGTYQLMGDKTTSDKVYDNTLNLLP